MFESQIDNLTATVGANPDVESSTEALLNAVISAAQAHIGDRVKLAGLLEQLAGRVPQLAQAVFAGTPIAPPAVPPGEGDETAVTHPEDTITESHPEGDSVEMIVGDPPPTP